MLKSVLVIGSGPIVIGQAAEFDYSGSQACRVLKDEGIRVILVNNNPATIMTDRSLADVIYSEPLTTEYLERIIEKEQPDALLAGMGGQTSLNLSMALFEEGILDKYGVKLIGTTIESIERAENRETFKSLMEAIGQPSLESKIANNVDEALEISKELGYPLVVRPAYTLGGTGGGFCHNEEELRKIADSGLTASTTSQVLIEKSIKGWKEVEYEMMRDHKGNTIVVCNMENIDPVGIHTGDSIVVAPSQTLTDAEYQMLRRASIDIVEAIGIVGGCNVQLALDPLSHDYFVIEVNPRVSRSSALASKATGYPIAKVATKIALGYTLDEISNDVTKKTKACFEPVLDYCALKIPKWPFDKFKEADKTLGTQMMATGEVMSIANNFEAVLLKGIRSLENDREGLYSEVLTSYTLSELFGMVKEGTDNRLFYVAELLRRHVSLSSLNQLTGIDVFFLKKVKKIVDMEERLRRTLLFNMSEEDIRTYKKLGFSDTHMASLLLKGNEEEIRAIRKAYNILPSYKMVDTCAGEFEAYSPYYYSTYDLYSEVKLSDKESVIIIGSGPISIGQGVEFDYCSVHGVYAVQALGYDAVLINNNPETVSTDFDISDRLYFEPITIEDVMSIVDLENPKGVILQYGGQTAIKLAEELHNRGVKILGTSYEGIHQTEDRHEFNQLMNQLGIEQPKGDVIYSLDHIEKKLKGLHFPLLCRPSYVIGGKGMKIVYSLDQLHDFLQESDLSSGVLLDEYIQGIELEVDCISDGDNIIIPGIMEHLESSGIHSGDSMSVYPPQSFSMDQLKSLEEITKSICRGMHAIGLVNIQFIYAHDKFYVIEVNPRASRTVPFLSKITDVDMVALATHAMFGHKLEVKEDKIPGFVALKVPVFSMEKIGGVDTALTPVMKSTGELMCIDHSLSHVLRKSQKALKYKSSIESILISVSDHKKGDLDDIISHLKEGSFKVTATKNTASYLEAKGLSVERISKLNKNSSILDRVKRGDFDMVINIPSIGDDVTRDGYKIRRQCVESKVQNFTSLEASLYYLDALNDDQKDNIYDICNL